MNGVNLIPAARIAGRAKRRQVRLWCICAAACGLALVGVQTALWNAWRPAGEDPAAEVDRLAKEIADAQKLDHASRARVLETKAAVQAAREISDQPDWGVLLTYIADKVGSEAVLDSFRLEPASKTSVPAPAAKGAGDQGAALSSAPDRGRCSLILTGVATSQDAASDVAIGLKQSELFQSVTLVETRRTVFMGSGVVAFRIECAIAGAGGGD